MPQTKLNTLFIVIDQLRADCVFGDLSAHLELPNIRALAKDAVSFENHYSVTSPCGPSRVSLLTAQYASNHGAKRNGTPLKRDTPNLASVLRDQGYDPLLFGYTDTSQDPRFLPPDDPRLYSYEELMPGFSEVVRMRMEGDSSAWEDHLRSHGYNVPPYPDMYRPSGETPDSPALYAAEHSDTAFLTDRTIEDLTQRDNGWFALLTYIRPHPPFVAPAPYNTMYDASAMPPALQSDEPDWHPFHSTARRKSSAASTVVGFPDLKDSEETTGLMRKLYFALATEVDHHIGRVIGWLKETGQYENTLIVLTADHGEMLGDYGLWGKMTFHDAAFHVPLIIRHPFAKARGTVITAPTESIDVTPTILECLEAETPHSMDGRSLKAFLDGVNPKDWRRVSVSELDFGNPIIPTAWQTDHGLSIDAANLSVLRRDQMRFVQFAGGLEPILMDVSGGKEDQNLTKNPAFVQTMLDLMQDMLCHRMVNTDGTFSRTLITDDGVKVAS
ncbi:sulfatase-like hydrolase/transferase [Marivita geojedonensis]|uniref:Phosphonate monoester hydrolase n=1 Tax=Marivita geojedonensis TaxID=1123756 RepID=A0A1X4NRB3_9RHOB|nr:sulfatase-like hydrolase/transferase [Marivita geojedonensis]OSQ53431.1 phosphonate monoester hydrolase [Marivita geojedonensis]PRY81580.1 arylsulfatase A-like enzyme [Marivita geojedonensis]